jgi:hypothetical protein
MIYFCVTEEVVQYAMLLCFKTSINYSFEDTWREFNKVKPMRDETFLLTVGFTVLLETQTRNPKSQDGL